MICAGGTPKSRATSATGTPSRACRYGTSSSMRATWLCARIVISGTSRVSSSASAVSRRTTDFRTSSGSSTTTSGPYETSSSASVEPEAYGTSIRVHTSSTGSVAVARRRSDPPLPARTRTTAWLLGRAGARLETSATDVEVRRVARSRRGAQPLDRRRRCARPGTSAARPGPGRARRRTSGRARSRSPTARTSAWWSPSAPAAR